MHVRRSLPRFAALLTAGLLLTSCGSDDPEPKFEAEPTPSTSASPSPSPTESATPEQETAKEFIRRWNDERTRMQNTGEVQAFTAMSVECVACLGLANRVAEIIDAGGSIQTDGWRILRIATEARNTSYAVTVDSRPTSYRESESGPMKSMPGGVTKHRIELTRQAGDWQVSYLTELHS